MAKNQNEAADVTVNSFTDENDLRRSAQSITGMKVSKSGSEVMSILLQENVQFPNVEKLCFYNGCFNDSVTRFATSFPTLKSLEFDRTTVENRTCIEQYIPTLKHLTVLNNLLIGNGRIFSVENVHRAVQLNPQLEGIKFRCDAFQCTATEVIQLLRFISERLQHLNFIGIHFSVDNYNNLKSPIVFKNVTKAMLYVEAYDFRWGPINMNSPVAFPLLLELDMFSYDIYTDDCINFAIKNQFLEKLKLEFQWITEDSDEEENIIPEYILYDEAEEDEDSEDSEDYVDEDGEDDDDDDDERNQPECRLEPFNKLAESLPQLKELSIGPITKFVGQDVVKILSAGKALTMLHIKLRYPLNHSPYVRYVGVKTIEREMSFIRNNLGDADWSHTVEFKFKETARFENKFRVANFIFQRNSHSS